MKSLKTWKQEKAKALRKYIIARFADEEIAITFNEYKSHFKMVCFWNDALNIHYQKTILQCEKTIDDDIQVIFADINKLKTEINDAWGETLDTTYNPEVYCDFEDLMRTFVTEKKRAALHTCWLRDPDRTNNVKKYEEIVRKEYRDILKGQKKQ